VFLSASATMQCASMCFTTRLADSYSNCSHQQGGLLLLNFAKGRQFSVSKLLLCMVGSGPHLIHASLDSPKSTSQMASRLVQPFLQGSQLWQSDRPTDRPRYSIFNNSPHLASAVVRPDTCSNLFSVAVSVRFAIFRHCEMLVDIYKFFLPDMYLVPPLGRTPLDFHPKSLASENYLSSFSVNSVMMCLCLAFLIQCWHLTDR